MNVSTSAVNPDKPLHAWLTVTGLLLFGVLLLWYFGIFSMILDADRTFLSILILVLFFAVTLYLGGAAARLGRLNRFVADRAWQGAGSGADRDIGWLSDHFSLCSEIKDGEGGFAEPLQGRLVEFIHSRHSLGWFAVDALIRLGLIGTVIGFILMLGAVYELKDEDISALQDLLGSMGTGMQVALYTTLTGICSSLILSIYCRILDYYADQLVGNISRLSVLGDQRLSGPTA